MKYTYRLNQRKGHSELVCKCLDNYIPLCCRYLYLEQLSCGSTPPPCVYTPFANASINCEKLSKQVLCFPGCSYHVLLLHDLTLLVLQHLWATHVSDVVLHFGIYGLVPDEKQKGLTTSHLQMLNCFTWVFANVKFDQHSLMTNMRKER